MGSKEVVVTPEDPMTLNQREFEMLALAFEDPDSVNWTALRTQVETILNERLVNKFRIEIEPIKGVRHIKVWNGETLFFSGQEVQPPGRRSPRKQSVSD